MLAYEKRNSFLQGLKPVYLGIIFFSIISLALIDGCLKGIFTYLKLIIPVMVLVVILNPLMSHNGVTVIYNSHVSVPIFGVFVITLEAVLYGLQMGIVLGVVTVIIGFGNMILHPDRTFGFFARYLKRSALLMSMTIRFFPSLMSSYKNIIEIEKLRGNLVSDKNFIKRIRNQGSVVNILFMSSLEDAVDVSESMYSRGFGVGKRSTYFREHFRKVDIMIITVMIIELVSLFYFNGLGLNYMNFYPHCDNPFSLISMQGIIICIMFLIPFFINWGWNLWRR
jgi:energy-coupling factor transport system permease protein